MSNKRPRIPAPDKGTKFGDLTFIEEIDHHGRKARHGKFVCDCGNEVIKTLSSVKTAKTGLQCPPCGYAAPQVTSALTFYAKEDALWYNEYVVYKGAAISRNYVFEVDLDTFINICKSNCYYCGVEPSIRKESQHTKNLERMGKDIPFIIRNGVDRYDNSKGYIEGNMVPCCTTCNRAKMATDGDDFIAWVKKVNDHMCSGQL